MTSLIARTTALLSKDVTHVFSPTSVQFKSEINDAFPRKRHQKRHLEFCTARLLSRRSVLNCSKQQFLDRFFSPSVWS
jgi:hypothetical protein